MAADSPLFAGVAAVDVTPAPGCYLAGYGLNRRATGVLDPLWARALALRAGHRTVVLATLDGLGLLRDRLAALPARLGLKPGQLVVAASHTHSGPDLIGFWGPDPRTSGVDEAILARCLEGLEQAARAALDALRPALVAFARASAPLRSAVNIRQPTALDPDVAVVHLAERPGGRGLATLVNWACHPEVLSERSTLLSADFVHPLRQRLESWLGGSALFVNGALGAMVTPDVADESPAEAERLGLTLGDAALSGLKASEELLDELELVVASREVELPAANPLWRAAIERGLVQRQVTDGRLTTRVTAWRLGPSTWLMVPGEVEPTVGLRWKRMMGNRHKFLVGLADDELGYILPPAAFADSTYAYEQTMSPGPETEPLLTEAVRTVLAAVEG